MIEAALCLIFGGAILTTAFLALWDDIKSKDYLKTEGKFKSAVVEKIEGNYEVKLFYEYVFKENHFPYSETAKSFTGNVSIWFLSDAETKARDYSEKRESIVLFVNPSKPSHARREIGINPISIAILIMGFIFFAVGMRLFLYD